MRKISTLFAAIIGLLLSHDVALGQGAAAPFGHSFFPTPTPSTTPKAKAKPTPRPAPVSAPTPKPTPAATAHPSATPRRDTATPKPTRAVERRRKVLQEKPVRAIEPRRPFIRRIAAGPNQGPRASRPTFDFSETNWPTSATLRSLENKWQGAIRKHDAATVDDLLADDFEGTSATGKSASKARILREIRQDKNVYKSAHLRGMSVRNKGSAVAVVTGTATETGTTTDGRPFTNSRRFTDTWKQHGGKWECISSKVTTLPKKER